MDYPDKYFVFYLLDGLVNGFDTGIENAPKVTLECRNNLSARRDPDFVYSALQVEVDNGYMVGPLSTLPAAWTHYRVSPLGVAQHKYSAKK